MEKRGISSNGGMLASHARQRDLCLHSPSYTIARAVKCHEEINSTLFFKASLNNAQGERKRSLFGFFCVCSRIGQQEGCCRRADHDCANTVLRVLINIF